MTPIDLSPIVFADLDDTLFQSARKMHEPAVAARLASRASNHRHSYMTRAQSATVDWLLKTTRLIPTTARSSEVLARTTIPFTDYKICSNGGAIITPDGVHDPEWSAWVTRVSRQHQDDYAALQNAIHKLDRASVLRSWLVFEAQTPVYFVIKINAGHDPAILNDAETHCRAAVGEQFVYHRNDRNMSFTPKGLTKADAVKAMLQRLPDTDKRPIWGMGDSVSDLGFMQHCQMIVTPSNSQIAKTHLNI